MEAVLASAVTGALKPVLWKLGSLLGNEYKQFKGVRDEIKSLRYELSAMDAFLQNMSEEEDPNEQDKAWMNEVRELSYAMEDCIDDFMQSINDKPEGFIEKIKDSLGKLGKMKSQRRIGIEIHGLKKRISEVGERNMRYKNPEAFSKTINKNVDPRALAMFEDASKLVGIDEPKVEILKLLTKGASTEDLPKLVSIIGPGGMGKTTLANQLYQHLRGDFEFRAFISVSRNPDMMNILRTILSEVTGKDYAKTEAGSVQQLIGKIKDFLADKRYFVVVDDIWDMDTWDVIKLAFPMNSSGSIINTTTRISDVAEACRASFNGDIYVIRHLNVAHARQLFHKRIFDSKYFPTHLEKVSDEILRKCDGLPLAIIAVSGLLSSRERTEDLWNKVRDSIGRAVERNHGIKRMMKILSLSYFDLPPHLKSCLLYMSTFPEDSIIERKGLINRWIGEGFIHKEDTYTPYEIGERCFSELLNRGLIQPGEEDQYGEITICRVHDIILDFIIYKCREENFVTLIGVHIPTIGTQRKIVRRLSLQGINQGNSTVLTTGLLLSHVRSLYMFGHPLEIPPLEKFRHLRVLNLHGRYMLKDHHLTNIVKLFHLRHLNLRQTSISELPEQIERLRCLEMLDLRGTKVKELPASTVNLGKLSHLFVDHVVKFPVGIAQMQALETLEVVRVSNQPFDFVCGLGKLKNLRNLAVFCNFEADSKTKDTIVAREAFNKSIVYSLRKLGTQSIRSLTIWYGSSLLQEPLCIPNLEELTTMASPILEVPKWVSSLTNLQRIRLEVDRVMQDDLCILGGLSNLLVLDLAERLRYKRERIIIKGEVGFRFLRVFICRAMFEPIDLMFEAGSMAKLQILGIGPMRVSLDFGIKNLPCLIALKFTGEVPLLEAVKAVMIMAANTHPNHPTISYNGYRL